MKQNLKLIIVAVLAIIFMTVTVDVQAEPGYAGEWKRTRLYGHAYASGDFSDEQYEFIKNHFEYFTIEKTHLRGVYGNPSHELTSRITADKLVAANPRCKPIMIYSVHSAYPHLFESEAQLRKDHPEYFYDNFEKLNLAERGENDWYIKTVDWNCDNSALHGIFLDGVNGAVRSGFKDQVAYIMKHMTSFSLMNGFHLTKKRDSMYDGLDLLKSADGVFIDSWFRRLCDSTTAAETMIDTCLQVPEEKVMVCFSANDSNGRWGTDHTFSHAAYLIVAHANTYYRWVNSTGNPKIWGADVLMDWHDDFDKEMGRPLGAARKNGYVYSRVFEHCTVTVDIKNVTSSIEWGQNNTQVVSLTGGRRR